MSYNNIFNALLKEAQFTKEMLGAGATQIRKANYAQKGIYFQAFTSLSTGLERIGKLCIMLDYFIENDGNFPDLNHLKRNIGHKLSLLYKHSVQIINRQSITLNFFQNLDSEIHQNIIQILTEFAEGDRYSNIDLIVNKKGGDPIASWFEKVDKIIFDRFIKEHKKQKISYNAYVIDQLISTFTLVQHTSETGQEIEKVQDASFLTGMYTAVAPYRQLYVLQIIRFWIELIRELQYKAMQLNKQEIPFFSEIFAMFYNADSYFKSRKSWDKMY